MNMKLPLINMKVISLCHTYQYSKINQLYASFFSKEADIRKYTFRVMQTFSS